jgi:acetyl-CoA C-acetyltransferase
MGLMTKQVTVSERRRYPCRHNEGRHQAVCVLLLPGGLVTAGNASQFSDGGRRRVVLMNESLASKKGLQPLGRFLGFAVAGCEPDEMGIGPVFAIPRCSRAWA